MIDDLTAKMLLHLTNNIQLYSKSLQGIQPFTLVNTESNYSIIMKFHLVKQSPPTLSCSQQCLQPVSVGRQLGLETLVLLVLALQHRDRNYSSRTKVCRFYG